MKRVLAVLMTVCFLLTGCGADTDAGEAVATAEDIFETLSAELEDYDIQETTIITKLLGLDEDSIISSSAAFAKDGGPGMVIVLECKDEDAALKAGERMNYYLTTLQNSAQQYAPDQLDVLNDGYVYTKDNFAVLFVGDAVDTAKKALAKILA